MRFLVTRGAILMLLNAVQTWQGFLVTVFTVYVANHHSDRIAVRVMALHAAAVMLTFASCRMARDTIWRSSIWRVRHVALLTLAVPLARLHCLARVAAHAGRWFLRCGVRLMAGGASRVAARKLSLRVAGLAGHGRVPFPTKIVRMRCVTPLAARVGALGFRGRCDVPRMTISTALTCTQG